MASLHIFIFIAWLHEPTVHGAPGDGRMGGPDGGGRADGDILTLADPYQQMVLRNFLHVILQFLELLI